MNGEDGGIEGPEYETAALFGPNCLVDDPQAIIKANLICNQAGLDTISAAVVVGMVLAAADEGLPVFFYGSTPAVLRRLQDNLCQRFPALQVAGSRPSAFGKLSASQRDQVVRQVRDSGAAMTFVGLGCPRQEVWVFEQRGALSMPLLAVGAAFDFHAGTLEQAPAVLQRAGLEWLFRLTREPGRLWRRYALLNPLYLALLGMQAAGLKTLDPDAGVAPPGPVRYG